MKKATFTILAALLLCSSMALASGSSAPTSYGAPSGGDTYSVTEVHDCIVTKIRTDGTIIIVDKKSGNKQEMVLNHDKKTKFTAQDKKAFDGRKKLTVDDLKIGQDLKVTVATDTGSVLKVKVMKQG